MKWYYGMKPTRYFDFFAVRFWCVEVKRIKRMHLLFIQWPYKMLQRSHTLMALRTAPDPALPRALGPALPIALDPGAEGNYGQSEVFWRGPDSRSNRNFWCCIIELCAEAPG
jgi:hypothetical protein